MIRNEIEFCELIERHYPNFELHYTGNRKYRVKYEEETIDFYLDYYSICNQMENGFTSFTNNTIRLIIDCIKSDFKYARARHYNYVESKHIENYKEEDIVWL